MGASKSRADIVGHSEYNRVWLLEHPKFQGKGFKYDFLFYVRNYHPLLSICLSHRHHPYSKCERLVIQIFLLILSWGNAALVVVASAGNCVCPDDPLYDTPEQIACRDGGSRLVLAVFTGLMGLVFGQLFKLCATCPCCRRHAVSDSSMKRRGAAMAEGGCYGIIWALTYTMLLLSACPNKDTWRIVFQTFVLGKIFSWFFWFIFAGLRFTISWHKVSKKEDSILLMDLVNQGREKEFVDRMLEKQGKPSLADLEAQEAQANSTAVEEIAAA